MSAFTLVPLTVQDQERVRQFVLQQWGSVHMVAHGVLYDLTTLPGFVAVQDERWVGLATYELRTDECELISLDSLREGCGIGTALLDAVKNVAWQAGCKRVVLITTNDNMHALRFYQRRGFVLTGIQVNALEQARKLKPEIPLSGNDGIPLRDEIALAFVHTSSQSVYA